MIKESYYYYYYHKSSLLNSTHYAMLYPQNGDRIMAIDSVTSLHPLYTNTPVTQLQLQ